MLGQRMVTAPFRSSTATWMIALIACCFVLSALPVCGEDATGGKGKDRSRLHEPVYRVAVTPEGTTAKQTEIQQQEPSRPLSEATTAPVANAEPAIPQQAAHPLDKALKMARESLAHIERDVADYTCTLVKRERVSGELLDHEFMTCKVRHERAADGRSVPFSVYLAFRKPDHMRGREVVYVDGENAGKLIAHQAGQASRFIWGR